MPLTSRLAVVPFAGAFLLLGSAAGFAAMAPEAHLPGRPLRLAATAVVRMAPVAGTHAPAIVAPEPRAWMPPGDDDDADTEPGAGTRGPAAAGAAAAPFTPTVASPAPSIGYAGLDDIPMVDSSYVVIPADLGGAVGRTRILQTCNNNYRILNKADGVTLATTGTATFWSGTGASLNTLTDPRTVYDPYNDRWITAMISDFGGANSSLEIAVSQTSDPAGFWYLYRTVVAGTGTSADFPILGFNKNWVCITMNMTDNTTGAFTGALVAVLDYPMLRNGSFAGAAFTGTAACMAPCVTYSATENTLYIPAHLSSGGATFRLDSITGPEISPTYNVGVTLTRPGGTWVQPTGNLLPQSGPVSGASACGATPCRIETQDAQIRSAPVFRNGFIWYAQTVGLPSGALTHTAAQWTKLAAPSGTVVDGGRLEDPTANSTNGGKWYAFPHVAVNAAGDMIMGFTQFGSSQHPSAGYALRLAGDAAGTIRDAVITHAGEDYYHKTFTTAAGRNRWGDFSTSQVDPTDDQSLWVVDEYAKARVGADDGNTATNSSRWGTWWAALAATPAVTLDAGPSMPEGNSGLTAFPFTVRLSQPAIVPVTVYVQTQDGTATAVNGDYQPLTTSITLPAGVTTATVTVNVVGDATVEPDETFGLAITAATHATVGLGGATASATIQNDDVDLPPTVAVDSPNGGENLVVGTVVPLTWTAADDRGVASVSLLLSRDDGGSWAPIATGIPNSGTYDWTVTAPGTNVSSSPNDMALLEVVATDGSNQSAQDTSDQPFSIFDPGALAVGSGPSVPTAFELGAAWPNPTAGPLRAEFAVPRAAPVHVSVLDLQGREVAVLADGVRPPGRYAATWDGRVARQPVAAGMYFVRLRSPGIERVRRIVIVP